MAIIRTSKDPRSVAASAAPVPTVIRPVPVDLDLTNLRVRTRRRPIARGLTERPMPGAPDPAAAPVPRSSKHIVASSPAASLQGGSGPSGAAEPAKLPDADPPTRRRGHATKDETGKWQPTGDYEEGWCKPPESGQFKKGGKPGPGRPKDAKSQDTILRERFDRKREVRMDGVARKLSQRELLAEMMFKDGLDPKGQKARLHLLSEAQRLYAVRDTPETTAPPPMADIRDMDHQLLAMVSGLLGIGDALPALNLVEMDPDLPTPVAEECEPFEGEDDWDAEEDKESGDER